MGKSLCGRGFLFELISVDEFEIKEVRVKNVDGEKHIFNRSEKDEAEEKIKDLNDQQNFSV